MGNSFFMESGGCHVPIYEYKCGSCGGRFEVIQKFSDPELTICKICNAAAIRKVLSPTAFVLKGNGWYATDYPSQDRKQASASEKPAADSKPAAGCASSVCAGSCSSKG